MMRQYCDSIEEIKNKKGILAYGENESDVPAKFWYTQRIPKKESKNTSKNANIIKKVKNNAGGSK